MTQAVYMLVRCGLQHSAIILCKTHMQKIPLRTCPDSLSASRTWTSLIPDEILVKIFKYLNKASVPRLPLETLNASLVCTHWQASAEFIIEHNMFNDPLADMECADLVRFLHILRISAELGINYSSRVQYITLNLKNCFSVDCWNLQAEDAYISICKLCHHARGMYIPKQKLRNSMLRGIRIPEQMRQTSIMYNVLRQKLITTLLTNTSIAEFQYEGIKTEEISKLLTNDVFLKGLRSLTLKVQREREISSTSNDAFLRALSNKAKDLRRLELHMCRSITGTGIKSGDIHCRKLRYLLLPGCDQLSWTFVCAVVEVCPKLYEIHCPSSIFTKNPNEICFGERLKVEILLQNYGFQPCNVTNKELWRRENRDSGDEEDACGE